MVIAPRNVVADGVALAKLLQEIRMHGYASNSSHVALTARFRLDGHTCTEGAVRRRSAAKRTGRSSSGHRRGRLEFVRTHGNDRLVNSAPGCAGARSSFDRKSYREHRALCTRPTFQPSPAGRTGRSLYRRRWLGAWIPSPAGADRGKVHPTSISRGETRLPHRRRSALAARWHSRFPRSLIIR